MNTDLNFYKTTDSGEAVSVIPQMRISSMDELTPTFNFVVTLNEFTFGFQSVSGLSVNNKVSYISEGGVNDHQVMVGCPSDDSPTLTFKRGILIRRPTIVSKAARAAAAAIPNNIARKSALLAVNMLDPQESLEAGPALGIIRVYSRRRTLRALYSFLSLGMVNWRADDLDATSSNIMYEEFTIAHTGLVRHPLSFVPQIVDAGKNFASDIKTSNNAKFIGDKAKENKKKRDEIEDLKKKKQEELDLMNEQKQKERELSEERRKLIELNKQLQEEQLQLEIERKQKERELSEERRKSIQLEQQRHEEQLKSQIEQRRKQREQQAQEESSVENSQDELSNEPEENNSDE